MRSLRVPRSLYLPAERAESRARLGGSPAVAGGELVYALGGGWLRLTARCWLAPATVKMPNSRACKHARRPKAKFFFCASVLHAASLRKCALEGEEDRARAPPQRK